MAFIKTVPQDQATGLVKQEYEKGIKRVGHVSQVLKLSSLAPEMMKAGIDFYLILMHRPSDLPRVQKEMIAVAVSRANQCHY
ncbi:MAG: carboxymuconolactone decarboxylase family protein [candidate division Zixibacteria bacterium]|nr:carboxymuconolactone decarboxylase family protein [candidate division Zixibacteria bacterium]